MKQPEVIDYQVIPNADVDGLVGNPAPESQPRDETTPNSLIEPETPATQLVTARFKRDQNVSSTHTNFH